MKKLHNMPVRDYVANVLVRILPVTILPYIFAYAAYHFFDEGWFRLIIVGIITTIGIGLTMISVGLNSNDRKYVLSIIKSKIIKH